MDINVVRVSESHVRFEFPHCEYEVYRIRGSFDMFDWSGNLVVTSDSIRPLWRIAYRESRIINKEVC